MPDDLVERRLDRGQRGQVLDQTVAPFHRLAREDRVAVRIEDGSGMEVALVVGGDLEQLRREGVSEVVEDVFARRDVDRDVRPFGGGDLGQAAVQKRLAGRDHLHHDGMPLIEIALDRLDQRRAFHRGQEMVEEALLVGFEGRVGGGFGVAVQGTLGAGDVDRLERRLDVLVDDLEGVGVGVVDRDLLARQGVLDDLVGDALVGQGAGGVEAERLEVARDHFHRGDAARLHGGDEVRA